MPASGGSGGGGAGGGGYSGALSLSDSGTFGVQLGESTVNNQTGLQLPVWAIPLALVLAFGFAIVALIVFSLSD